MNGGEISGNTAWAGGGVFLKKGSFEKTPAFGSYTSGVIFGNTATGNTRPNTVYTAQVVYWDGGLYSNVSYRFSSLDSNTGITTKNFDIPPSWEGQSRALDTL
ncbi:MAG: hypothetical protein LBD37_10345 [Treponema sp.]|jgi:hypothetical protein|nr:hypothetical protein [Treponema sp.]